MTPYRKRHYPSYHAQTYCLWAGLEILGRGQHCCFSSLIDPKPFSSGNEYLTQDRPPIHLVPNDEFEKC